MSIEPKRYRVLFICIGNSCRSQMAEGFARHHHSDIIYAYSAGVMPASIVQPETISVMAEKGVSIESQWPKPIRDVEWNSADLVINMSGTGILQLLPGYHGGNLIWNVEDPIGRPLKKYRAVRDQIEDLIHDLRETLSRQPAR